MTLPTKTRSWHLPKPNPEGHKLLQLTEDDVEALKPTEVLVKIHAVSINYTDLSISKGIDGTK
jgi:NADPH:quinone reductase-like Zn-dependent oxidoreductase